MVAIARPVASALLVIGFLCSLSWVSQATAAASRSLKGWPVGSPATLAGGGSLAAAIDGPPCKPGSVRVAVIKAVHYFGVTSPVNIWDYLEVGDLDPHFSQLASDGFNAIVLLTPWSAFQPSVEPVVWDEDVVHKLHLVLAAAERNGLRVIPRIGYSYSLNPHQQLAPHLRCEALLTGSIPLWAAWDAFVERLARVFALHPRSYHSALITWEDFSCPLHVWMYQNLEDRLRLAKASHFQWFLHSKGLNPAMLRDASGKPFASLDEVPVPTAIGMPEVKAVYVDYVNVLWRTLLKRSRAKLPSLSLEVRTDMEAVHQRNGAITWHDNDAFADDVAPAPRAMYWAPFFGAANDGRDVTAQSGLTMLRWALSRVTKDGRNRNVFVDQFNFMDHTPEFPQNSNIQEDQLDTFIADSAAVLAELSVGYGLWAYRDYRKSWLYNGHFAKGLEGWNVTGCRNCSQLQAADGFSKLFVDATTSAVHVAQKISQQGDCSMPHVNFCIDIHVLSGVPMVAVRWQGKLHQIPIWSSPNDSCVSVPIAQSGIMELVITGGSLTIDNMHWFCHVHTLDVYDAYNQPKARRDAVVELNKRLPSTKCVAGIRLQTLAAASAAAA